MDFDKESVSWFDFVKIIGKLDSSSFSVDLCESTFRSERLIDSILGACFFRSLKPRFTLPISDLERYLNVLSLGESGGKKSVSTLETEGLQVLK